MIRWESITAAFGTVGGGGAGSRACGPARRAARLDVLAAIAAE